MWFTGSGGGGESGAAPIQLSHTSAQTQLALGMPGEQRRAAWAHSDKRAPHGPGGGALAQPVTRIKQHKGDLRSDAEPQ
jgi:hypothetical protein